MGVAILSGVFKSLQSRPSGASSSNAQTESGYSTPTQSFSLSAPEASLPGKFVATVGREETVRKLQKTLGEIEYVKSGRLGSDGVQVVPGEGNLEAVKGSDVILICCKPQMVEGILQQDGMQEALEGKLVISICAGVRLDQLKELCPASTVVIRAMPNTPSKVSFAIIRARIGMLKIHRHICR
jgi:pyrroline-5-carboxylate reductase